MSCVRLTLSCTKSRDITQGKFWVTDPSYEVELNRVQARASGPLGSTKFYNQRSQVNPSDNGYLDVVASEKTPDTTLVRPRVPSSPGRSSFRHSANSLLEDYETTVEKVAEEQLRRASQTQVSRVGRSLLTFHF